MSTLQLFAPAWMSKAKGSVELLELMGDKKKREEAQAFWKNLVAEGNRINELIQVQGQADKIPGLLREAGLDREAAGRELAEALGSARSILQKSNDKATQLMDAMAIRETALKESEAGLSGNQAAHLEAVRLADEKMVADLCAATWRLTPRGIQIEDKEKIKKRLGRSPDRGDSIIMAYGEGKKDDWGAMPDWPDLAVA